MKDRGHRRLTLNQAIFIVSIFIFLPHYSFACDPCSLYNAARVQGLVPGTFSVAISEQNTSFDRAKNASTATQRDGEVVREFSTTQFSAAYDFNQELGLQVSLPLIIRRFDKVAGFGTQTKTDSGLGDMTILGRYSFLNLRSAEWAVVAGVTGGVKLPSGDTGTLESFTQEGDKTSERSLLRHHTVASASGGRALTFGTGSTDVILGTNLFTRYRRALFLADIQYGIRTEGSFNYQFANDLIWSAGPGYYLSLEHQSFLATRLALTGEFKASDTFNNTPVSGSAISNLYIGPELLFSLTSGIGGQVGFDMRTTGEDPGATIVPEYRIRAALSYRFS